MGVKIGGIKLPNLCVLVNSRKKAPAARVKDLDAEAGKMFNRVRARAITHNKKNTAAFGSAVDTAGNTFKCVGQTA